MTIVILHNDLRVYWKGRIAFLRKSMAAHNITLASIELFGKGSPYAFDALDSDNCLFPDNSYNELSKAEIKKSLFGKLDYINPDIVIGGSIVFSAGALGLRWCKKNNKKFIMFDDGKPSGLKRSFITNYIKNTITRQVDGLWLPSSDYDSEYEGLFVEPTLSFYGYNTVDNELFKFDGDKRFDHNSLIYIGRLVYIKNLERLFKAWKKVEEANLDYKLKIIGIGPEQDGLKQLAKELGIQRIEFLGMIPNNELPKQLFRADAFILPSLSESWGLVVNEAMAAQLPLLLSKNVNAAATLLKEGVNGYSFDPLDSEDIAGQMLKFILLDERQKRNMGEMSLALVNEMDYHHMEQNLLEAIPKIVAQKQKKPGIVASIFINLWEGGYNVASWDKTN